MISSFANERDNDMKPPKSLWLTLAVLTILAVFFAIFFYVDNKYETPPPYGKSGVINISRQDLNRHNPIFLIDGWLLTDERVVDKPTYIGEFSNLQRRNLAVSPHGRACYRLTLHYDGEPVIVSVDFPQLSLWYRIFFNGTLLTTGKGNGHITFLMTQGDHILSVETLSKTGYYSGMYFPPALGVTSTLLQTSSMQSFAYALGFFGPFVLAVFTFFQWRIGGKLSRCFGMMCCWYALYMFRYFVFLFSMQLIQYWFLIQSVALYGLCFCVVQLTVLASGEESSKVWKWSQNILRMLSVNLIALSLSIPKISWAVFVHSRLTDFYYIFIFCCVVYFVGKGMIVKSWESCYTLAGGVVFGAGLLLNLFFSNHFEPIRFFWQFEWCGLLLVLLFGAMMVSRGRRILRENETLTNHLEEQVKERTKEITFLLEERKAFFSDMAHDLKAPVFATQSFIEAIRRSGVGVDKELCNYLDQAEARQWEMARRLQGLSAINALDKIQEEWVQVSVAEFLSELYAIYYGEAEVHAVYFAVKPPKQDVFLTAQPEKLNILFENLIYNALRATPPEGSIMVSAEPVEDKIRIVVEDTGCGIPEKELPFLFQRFYVGENNKENGTGLGLYIAHSIVTELCGTIHVSSTVGEGTKFVMEFPITGCGEAF